MGGLCFIASPSPYVLCYAGEGGAPLPPMFYAMQEKGELPFPLCSMQEKGELPFPLCSMQEKGEYMALNITLLFLFYFFNVDL